MAGISHKKRIWGWMMFDWASQPYNTLLLTFIFGPYFAKMVSAKMMAGGTGAEAAHAQAQAIWGYGLTATGLTIAVLAPILGAIADSSGRHMPWIRLFSLFYFVGAFGLWWTAPAHFSVIWALIMFGIGFIGMEFTTIFTNGILPSLGTEKEIGRISGSGFALGYWGGVLSLVIMLLFFVENSGGKTLLGIAPLLGLDPATHQGTRFVGPFTAIWFAVFMIPFFMYVREDKSRARSASLGTALSGLGASLASLLRRHSLASFLLSSLLFRDALNGLYGFGAIYAAGVLNWSITQIGIFGIGSAITAAIFAWLGGKADSRYGPKPVIVFCILALTIVCIIVVNMTRNRFFGVPLAPGSALPDIVFYICGGIIGAAGGVLQSASRSMMVRHTNPARPTEAFGLYALSGKATAFLAPAAIAVMTQMTGSQRLGITPLIALFVLSLILLAWVNPKGDQTRP